MRPVTACATHEPTQIAVITISSEFEYTRVCHPPAFAHFGESGSAYSPIFWSSSDSPPALPSSLDSVEPRSTSHTVPRMNSVNWRYSDCQFSMTSTTNDDDVR